MTSFDGHINLQSCLRSTNSPHEDPRRPRDALAPEKDKRGRERQKSTQEKSLRRRQRRHGFICPVLKVRKNADESLAWGLYQVTGSSSQALSLSLHTKQAWFGHLLSSFSSSFSPRSSASHTPTGMAKEVSTWWGRGVSFCGFCVLFSLFSSSVCFAVSWSFECD